VLFMELQQRNGLVAAVWILASGLIGFIGNVTSIRGAALVLGFGLAPPILMMLFVSAPIPRAPHDAARERSDTRRGAPAPL
jgi:hypothetical protein